MKYNFSKIKNSVRICFKILQSVYCLAYLMLLTYLVCVSMSILTEYLCYTPKRKWKKRPVYYSESVFLS